ncbi:MAG: chemotaxis protein methyltransferase CheR [Thermoanaerobaculia bacterium]|jgi:chemotaxis protein methyltransferase CheR|nr:chemotaxis protein methyltransferase CheR [Thermoanaerobaculia bacterium]
MLDTNAIRPLSDREFRLLQQLIYRHSGIHLSEGKKALMSGRLTRRLRALGCANFTTYYEHVEADPVERTSMLDCISTNETSFFREPKQFEYLDETFLPQWRALGDAGTIPKRIRAWSAACSTGEEPYSIAMILAAHFPSAEGWSVEVLASDLSTRALAVAREGMWPIDRGASIPDPLKKAWMLRGTRSEEGRMRAQPRLKSMIEFRRINLNDPDYGIHGSFDLIFCRNVLIYFSRESKALVIDRLVKHLSPAGMLFLGHAESLAGSSHALEHAGPTIYRRSPHQQLAS